MVLASALEQFWDALAAIAETRNLAVSALVAEVDVARDPSRPLASALESGRCRNRPGR